MSIAILSSAKYRFSKQECEQLYEIMRDAYARTEFEIWGENYVRIPQKEFEQLIDKGQIFGAQLNGQIVGTILLKKVNSTESSFGLLGVHQSAEGQGIATQLIETVEREARQSGSNSMIIDILRPRDFELTVKNRLRQWYEGMGYTFTHEENFEDRRPDRARYLKVPSVFDCFRKELSE